MRWTSPGHESAGGPLAAGFLRRIGAPLDYDPPVSALVVNHLAHHHGNTQFSDTSVRRLARKLAPATIDDLAAVMRADANGRPPLPSAEIHLRIDELVARAHSLAIADSAPKPIVMGRHLIALGLRPDRTFKPLLDSAFEAQLDGAFEDEPGGIDWVRRRLAERTPYRGSSVPPTFSTQVARTMRVLSCPLWKAFHNALPPRDAVATLLNCQPNHAGQNQLRF
jgi:tRNA nucleotidyltransferase (CCA-adding enzyme)